jgi:hypothetical protein
LNMSILFAFFFRKIRHPTKTHLWRHLMAIQVLLLKKLEKDQV